MSETDSSQTEQTTTTPTGTPDKDYNLFRYIEGCLETASRMETYRRDAEREHDEALAALFTMAQKDNRKGAEIGKKLLAGRLSGVGVSGAAPSDTAASGAPSAERTGSPGSEAPTREDARESDAPIDVMAASKDRGR